ncbi:NAD-dependent epimerase/dehydratase family protein [Flintibacter muris]|uniref:NAD-dependent epimerase/dehydratase family protein n=1 Tax=Flintibacter muris TaxID=2941327 RepID=UPI00203D65C0|nr:NAD-dependent epimerase/dehydratase family protein [Flintibacter muris]
MKRVLITGITGYIGSRLAQKLLPDWEVCGLVREPLNLEYISDIAPQIEMFRYDGTYDSMNAALEACQPDLVYHLATYYTGGHSAEHIQKLLDSNISMGLHLLEAMSEHAVPALVYASTVMAHYQGEEYRPVNLYAATKQAFSDLLAYYVDAGLLRTVTLVLSDTYGPGDHRPKILNLIRKAAQSGEKMALSTGEQDYDVVYIDDVVSAFRLAGEQLLQGKYQNSIFQIVPNCPLTLRETVEKMLQVNNLTLNAGWGERQPAEREMKKAVRIYPNLPEWKAEVPLRNGLKRLVERDVNDGA